MNVLQNALKRAYDDYEDVIYSIARKVQKEIINPYFEKQGITFLVGNGTYYLENQHGPIYPEDLPIKIRTILESEVEDSHNSELGLWMDDYKPEGRS